MRPGGRSGWRVWPGASPAWGATRIGRDCAKRTSRSGVFDLHKIRETELAALHRFDLTLVEAVPRLRAPFQAVADAALDESAFPQALRAVEAALQEFEQTLAERERLARGL